MEVHGSYDSYYGYWRAQHFFNGFLRIDLDAAKILAGIEENALFLDSLEEIDKATAEALAKYRGHELRLGSREIENTSLQQLIACKARHLSLGFRKLDDLPQNS